MNARRLTARGGAIVTEVRGESQWKRALGNNSLPFLVQWVIRRGFRVVTARMRTLPDFIIIGAQRCGTTSLYNYLVEHPRVSPAFMKETHFFDFNFHKGVNWYRAFFPSAGFLSSPYQASLQPRHYDGPDSHRRPDSHQRPLGQRRW
jgi:hypothetical protein